MNARQKASDNAYDRGQRDWLENGDAAQNPYKPGGLNGYLWIAWECGFRDMAEEKKMCPIGQEL